MLPLQNANEASVVQDFETRGFRHLSEVIAFLKGEGEFPPVRFVPPSLDETRG